MLRYLQEKGAAKEVCESQFFYEAHNFRSNINDMFLKAEEEHFKKLRDGDEDRPPILIIFGKPVIMSIGAKGLYDGTSCFLSLVG